MYIIQMVVVMVLMSEVVLRMWVCIANRPLPQPGWFPPILSSRHLSTHSTESVHLPSIRRCVNEWCHHRRRKSGNITSWSMMMMTMMGRWGQIKGNGVLLVVVIPPRMMMAIIMMIISIGIEAQLRSCGRGVYHQTTKSIRSVLKWRLVLFQRLPSSHFHIRET